MKKGKNIIKTIIFDIGGVLEVGNGVVWTKGKSAKGVHEAIVKKLAISLDQWFDTIGEIYEKTITGKTSEKEFLRFLTKTFGHSQIFFKNLFLRNYRAHFHQNHELYNAAFKLKKKGYQIGILSDQHPLSKKAVVPKSKIKHFNPVIISCDVGTRKPHKGIYQLLLKHVTSKPSEIVFIDNQTWNLVPAKKLGMKTILFKNNKQCLNELKKLGVKV